VEAGGGFRGGARGRVTQVLPNPEDRGEFVAYLLEDFGNRRMRVDPAVVEFILQKVLVSDEQWARGWRARRFNPDRVKAKIEGSLELAADRAEEAGARVIDLPVAEAVYEEARKRRACVFPIRKC
jgi:hypothetical protein